MISVSVIFPPGKGSSIPESETPKQFNGQALKTDWIYKSAVLGFARGKVVGKGSLMTKSRESNQSSCPEGSAKIFSSLLLLWGTKETDILQCQFVWAIPDWAVGCCAHLPFSMLPVMGTGMQRFWRKKKEKLVSMGNRAEKGRVRENNKEVEGHRYLV